MGQAGPRRRPQPPVAYSQWIEPLFAEGKLWHGMRRFRTRTLEKVDTEALMIATGQNIKRLLAFGGSAPKK